MRCACTCCVTTRLTRSGRCRHGCRPRQATTDVERGGSHGTRLPCPGRTARREVYSTSGRIDRSDHAEKTSQRNAKEKSRYSSISRRDTISGLGPVRCTETSRAETNTLAIPHPQSRLIPRPPAPRRTPCVPVGCELCEQGTAHVSLLTPVLLVRGCAVSCPCPSRARSGDLQGHVPSMLHITCRCRRCRTQYAVCSVSLSRVWAQ